MASFRVPKHSPANCETNMPKQEDVIFINSYEHSVYQIIRKTERGEELVSEAKNVPLQFKNLHDAKVYLRSKDVKVAFLRQENAYDEMIGLPCRREISSIKIPINN